MKTDTEKNHIDEWLKIQIRKGIEIIDNVLKNDIKEWELYYTGHLQKDILTNFPGRTSKKIFKGYRTHLDNNNLHSSIGWHLSVLHEDRSNQQCMEYSSVSAPPAIQDCTSLLDKELV